MKSTEGFVQNKLIKLSSVISFSFSHHITVVGYKTFYLLKAPFIRAAPGHAKHSRVRHKQPTAICAVSFVRSFPELLMFYRSTIPTSLLPLDLCSACSVTVSQAVLHLASTHISSHTRNLSHSHFFPWCKCPRTKTNAIAVQV